MTKGKSNKRRKKFLKLKKDIKDLIKADIVVVKQGTLCFVKQASRKHRAKPRRGRD